LFLRQQSRVLGIAARGIAAAVRALSVPFGDLRLAGHRLPGRAHALRMAGAQLLLRRRRSRGIPEGSLLLISERVDGAAYAPSAPPLELDAGRYDRCVGLHERRRGGAIPEWCHARGETYNRTREPLDVAGRLHAWDVTGCLT